MKNAGSEHGMESSRTAGATSGCMQSGSSSRSGCNQGAAVEADAIWEQQLKRTQSGSSNQSQCNLARRSAAEEDGIGEPQLKRREQQLKRVDAIGEQQLLTESCPVQDYSPRLSVTASTSTF